MAKTKAEARVEVKTLNDVVTALLEQNPEFAQEIVDNDGNNYRLVEARVKPLISEVGRITGRYIKTNELVWACINAATGSDDGNSLKLSL